MIHTHIHTLIKNGGIFLKAMQTPVPPALLNPQIKSVDHEINLIIIIIDNIRSYIDSSIIIEHFSDHLNYC